MKKLLVAALCVMAGFSGVVSAADNAEELIKQNLHKVDPRIKVKSISPAPLAGMSEVELNSGEVIYADSKGEYFLIGQLYRYTTQAGFVNLSEEKAKEQRKAKLDAVSEKEMVVFAPEGEVKATVNIFTDVDCPYCRKLHDEVPKLNEMGIQVNYLAFPRNGQGTKTYNTMVSIWCAKGAEAKREAMTEAKQGMNLDKADCNSPVMSQLALGQAVGVTGTPAMVFEDGSLVPGYVPAARLSKMLGL
ncbi:DsbC family protein [Neptuniibacter sp.]|uniref:DsbC family protein n=1 Tax=Neptuniibacter sp. TaxID=1962643 RepID=UPI002637E32D|nr:DsbC family protein [Neptuniibacter sp.]MCP4597678.1 DsbC family protein [Neptuniibacter sp.]